MTYFKNINIVHLLITWLSLLPTLLPAQTPSHYINPVSDSVFVADPFVLQHQQTYYLYGTSAADGFKAWKSTNLIDWEPMGYVYQRPEDSWATKSFWAPEVVHYQDKFYLIFSAKGNDPDGLRICMAVSDSPEGPFEDWRVPLFDAGYSCIDGHVYIHQNQPYLYYEMVGVVGEPWKNKGYFKGTILGCELSDDLSRIISDEPTVCVIPTQPWETPADGRAISVEGMTVFRLDSTLYMTYSANHYADPRYGVGYATASHPLGPWTKSENNPILAQKPSAGVSGPGHNSIIRSPDGNELFIVYHSHADPDNPSPRRVLNIDRLVVEPDGKLRVIGPTRTPQPVPSGG
ncbi:MAG: glycoside hydrolase family 43 protein [Tunicatimonas sp.]|uniref:glycoside hydrolase family 43 protein n=1 Tax=Tunicatimonas sp. TaxID=1940096 RepID=UPI003C7509B4